MRWLIFLGFIWWPAAVWGQIADSAGLPPALPGGLPSDIAGLGIFMWEPAAAVACNLRDPNWATRVDDYAFEASVFILGKGTTSSPPPSLYGALVNYYAENLSYGAAANQQICQMLPAILPEADHVHDYGFIP